MKMTQEFLNGHPCKPEQDARLSMQKKYMIVWV